MLFSKGYFTSQARIKVLPVALGIGQADWATYQSEMHDELAKVPANNINILVFGYIVFCALYSSPICTVLCDCHKYLLMDNIALNVYDYVNEAAGVVIVSRVSDLYRVAYPYGGRRSFG